MQDVLITGASRGIGLGLARAYLQRGARVHAVVRQPQTTALQALQEEFGARLALIACDLTDAAAAQHIGDALTVPRLDVALFNAGIYGPAHQDVAQIDETQIAQLFLGNAIAPLRIARQLAPRLDAGGVIAFMSSQMASVALARAASMPLYGASKAALNSLIRSWSQADDAPQATLLALHPGWVRTDMGGAEADLDVSSSAAGLLSCIERHAGRAGCHFVDYRQQALPW